MNQELETHHDQEFEVEVGLGAEVRRVRVDPRDEIVEVRDDALRLFDREPERHLFLLFSAAGVRLINEETVERARVKPHERLSLRFEIFIIYNGLRKDFLIDPEERVRTILDDAIKAFGITQAPHLLGLFTEGGAELSDQKTAKESGIRPGEKLLLRPSAVRGG